MAKFNEQRKAEQDGKVQFIPGDSDSSVPPPPPPPGFKATSIADFPGSSVFPTPAPAASRPVEILVTPSTAEAPAEVEAETAAPGDPKQQEEQDNSQTPTKK
jgi:hypothetical protein